MREAANGRGGMRKGQSGKVNITGTHVLMMPTAWEVLRDC